MYLINGKPQWTVTPSFHQALQELIVAVLGNTYVSSGFTTTHLSSVCEAALHSAPWRIPVRYIFDGSWPQAWSGQIESQTAELQSTPVSFQNKTPCVVSASIAQESQKH